MTDDSSHAIAVIPDFENEPSIQYWKGISRSCNEVNNIHYGTLYASRYFFPIINETDDPESSIISIRVPHNPPLVVASLRLFQYC